MSQHFAFLPDFFTNQSVAARGLVAIDIESGALKTFGIAASDLFERLDGKSGEWTTELSPAEVRDTVTEALTYRFLEGETYRSSSWQALNTPDGGLQLEPYVPSDDLQSWVHRPSPAYRRPYPSGGDRGAVVVEPTDQTPGFRLTGDLRQMSTKYSQPRSAAALMLEAGHILEIAALWAIWRNSDLRLRIQPRMRSADQIEIAEVYSVASPDQREPISDRGIPLFLAEPGGVKYAFSTEDDWSHTRNVGNLSFSKAVRDTATTLGTRGWYGAYPTWLGCDWPVIDTPLHTEPLSVNDPRSLIAKRKTIRRFKPELADKALIEELVTVSRADKTVSIDVAHLDDDPANPLRVAIGHTVPPHSISVLILRPLDEDKQFTLVEQLVRMGRAAQRLCLEAPQLELAVCPAHPMNDRRVNNLLDGTSKGPTHSLLIGIPSRNPDQVEQGSRP